MACKRGQKAYNIRRFQELENRYGGEGDKKIIEQMIKSDEIFNNPREQEKSDADVEFSDQMELGEEVSAIATETVRKEEDSKNPPCVRNGHWKNVIGLKTLDLYILKKFLGTYFMSTLLILAVVAMFDVTEKLDAFLTAPIKETLFDYFASFLPYFGNQLSPLFVFISVIFFTSKMAGNSEIIAILSSGISFRRLMLPYMIGAAIIAALTFSLTNYIIPPTNINRLNYTNKYVKNKRVSTGTDLQIMVSPGVVAYFGRFDNESKTGYRFSLDKFEGKRLVSRLTAQTAEYDSARMYHWKVREYMIRNLGERKESINRGMALDTVIPIEPRDFLIQHNDQETMTTPELATYIEKQKSRGVANIEAFEIEKEKRYASTAAAFILTLIGMSLSSRKVKGGMGLNIGIGLALSFSYILFSTVTSSFAISGLTTPFIAMEIPNIVYLLIGIILYIRASKF
ncbi:MAG: LptF/LptG family permease [Prevotella sp.]|nr:LptF/LptG family permease [Bacteroides sp.]MCM1365856.1 LptF/LptG family permease [Prevotella sp.]